MARLQQPLAMTVEGHQDQGYVHSADGRNRGQRSWSGAQGHSVNLGPI